MSGAAWKSRAIRRMAASRRRTLALLSRLPDEAIRRPRTQGAWSIKDVLAHIAAWEAEGTRRLMLITRGQAARVHFYDDMREADRFNARVVAAGRRRSLPATLARLARVRAELVAALRGLPAGALRDPAHRYPVAHWLPEFAWTHEEGHARDIRDWWRAAKREARP